MNNYLCVGWQGFIQQTVTYVSRGYSFYSLTRFPEKKKERWPEIDEKLMGKYQTGKSKYQRTRQKQKQIANFVYLRWNSLAIILHTKGLIAGEIIYDDRFFTINRKPLPVKISNKVTLHVYLEADRVSVRLAKDSYRLFKADMLEVCRYEDGRGIVRAFNKINGLPAYSGIIAQKERLAAFTVKQARRNHILLHKNELRLETRRKMFKVFV